MAAEKLTTRVLAVVLAVVAAVVLLWSAWMWSFLVGVGYQDNSDAFYLAYGGVGFVVAAALAATAVLLLKRRQHR
ncbi:MAG: hypothetical protein AB7R89_09690 [Dehalococcoidia bacterium]